MKKSFNKDNFLVLGGTGFIGSNLVRYLAEDRHQPVEGDLADINNLQDILYEAMEGCNGVFNLAAETSQSNSRQTSRELVNIKAVKIIAKVARDCDGVRLVHVSSSTALGIPKRKEVVDENMKFNVSFDHYGLTKHLGDKSMLAEVERGLDAVIAIPCSTVGHRGMKEH